MTDAIPFDPRPLPVAPPGWQRALAPAIAVAVLVAALWQLSHLDLHQVLAVVPHTPNFWLVFAMAYATPVLADWIIYRRLWGLPPRGAVALLRKLVGNEVLIGYIGEVYFYAWARRHSDLIAAPFGAIKDVSILSALVGNLLTMAALLLAWPVLGLLPLEPYARPIVFGMALVALMSFAALWQRHRLFGLPTADLGFVATVHALRIILVNGLAALLWHVALPDVGLDWWLLLAALRLLVSRLPLLPGKDLLFAGLVVFLVGPGSRVDDAIAAVSSLIVATHLVLGLVLMAMELRRRGEGAS